MVYMIFYFFDGIKRIHPIAFTTQQAAHAHAMANDLQGWHLVQLEVRGSA